MSSNPTVRRSTYSGAANLVASTKTGPIDLRGMGSGAFKIPAGWGGGASVTFEVARDPLEASDFGALHDTSDAAVTQAVTAGKWYPFPAGVMDAGAVKIVAASSTTAEILYFLRA